MTLWTQKEAATELRVSVSYLRNSDCPKVLLPGNGKKGKPMVRYEIGQVRAWWEAKQPNQRAG